MAEKQSYKDGNYFEALVIFFVVEKKLIDLCC